MKTEAILAKLADRDLRTAWEKLGSLDIHGRAVNSIKESMTKNIESLIPDETDEQLQA